MRTCPTTGHDPHTFDVTAVFHGAQQGDAACWEEIVHHYGGVVQAAVGHFRLSASERADAAQNAWLRLFEKAHTIRDPDRLPGWLATTARRECLALITRRRSECTVDVDLAERASAESSPEALVLAADERRIVRAATAELSGRSALLIEALFGPQPASYAEISERLDIPIGSIGPTRARLIRRLRDRLEQAAA